MGLCSCKSIVCRLPPLAADRINDKWSLKKFIMIGTVRERLKFLSFFFVLYIATNMGINRHNKTSFVLYKYQLLLKRYIEAAKDDWLM